MRFRTVGFIVTLALGLLAAPLAAEAQQPTNVHRIGRLSAGSPPSGPNPEVEAFRQGLRDLGYIEGQNVVLAWSGREGAEIVAVMQTSNRVALPVFVRPEIRDWHDLRGRQLAVDAVDTAFALVLRRILLAHNLDLTCGDYELVAVGATGQRFESMTRGDTFAAILSPPWDAKAQCRWDGAVG